MLPSDIGVNGDSSNSYLHAAPSVWNGTREIIFLISTFIIFATHSARQLLGP
jgi:hypothetical protein